MARFLGDALLAPFIWLPPLAGLVALSAVLGVVLLGAFRLLTPQRRLRRVKHQMSACVYELWLFSASPLIVLWAQGRALWLTAVYLLLALPSLVVLAPVVGAVASRAALWHEVRPMEPGEEALVSFTLDPLRAARRPKVEAAGTGLRVIPPLVLVNKGGRTEGHIRLGAVGPGEHKITIRVGQVQVHKIVEVGGSGPVSWRRARANDAQLLFSRETPLPTHGPLTSITVHYPDRAAPWPGTPWWAHPLLISMLVALALRRRLGVVF